MASVAGVARADMAKSETWMLAEPAQLVEKVREVAMHVMMVERLDIDVQLMDAGMDSIESVDFRNQLESALPGVKLPGALVLEYPTVGAIAGYLVCARSALLASPLGSPAVAAESTDTATAAKDSPDLLDPEFQDVIGNVVLPATFPEPAVACHTGPRATNVGAVLLTGATGFLGIHLLVDFLECTCRERHPPRILLVVRAASAHAGMTRIVEAAKEHGIVLADVERARIDVIPTQDLSLPRLGIDSDGFEAIRAAGVHTIIHNAAQVNWFKSYKQLKQNNVLTTLELLQLAAELGAKVGYVSSISSLPLWNPEQAMVEDLDNSWEHVNMLKMSGYSQTKWISEHLCRAACRRGVAVSIFRMPFIIGNSRTGCMNLQDTPARIIAACIELGEVPVSVQLDCVAVDVVARIVVRVSLRPGTSGVNPLTGQLIDGCERCCCVHIATKFGKLGMEKVFEQLRCCGYHDIRWQGRSEWVQKAMQQQTSAAPIQVFDRLFNRPALVNSMRTETLQCLCIQLKDIMEVTPKHLTAMIRFLQAKRMVPLPAAAEELHSSEPVLARQVSPEEQEPGLEYDECRRLCENELARYHGTVAARNLHWYREQSGTRGSWLTFELEGGEQAKKCEVPFPLAGSWRGFALPGRTDVGGAGGASSCDTWEPFATQSKGQTPLSSAACVGALADDGWTPWATVLDDSAAPFYQWFVGAQTNAAMNEVDRHLVTGFGFETAHIVDLNQATGAGPVEQQLTRRQLFLESALASLVLQRPPLSLKHGDRVLLFLPTRAEQLVWTEACKRLGVIYSACTPGLVAAALAERICELAPKLLITTQIAKDQRWAASVEGALKDFVPVQWVLEAVQAAAAQVGCRGSQEFTTTFGTSQEFTTAVVAAYIALQDVLGGSLCINLTSAVDAVMEQVKGQLREHMPDGYQAATLSLALSDLGQSVQRYCQERASCGEGSGLHVLFIDRTSVLDEQAQSEVEAVAVDASAANMGGDVFTGVGFAMSMSGTKQRHLSSELCAEAVASLREGRIGKASTTAHTVSAASMLGSLTDSEVLTALWATANPPLPVEANFPLFVCYTSGSCTKPHGILHCHGYEAGLMETLRWSFGARPGKDRILAISHPGWIVGQSYMYAAPLCARITSVAMEGSPIRPSQTRFAEVIQRLRVTILKTGSTFLREVMSCPKAVKSLRSDFDFSSLRVATFCSEPLSPQVQAFAMHNICAQCINSYWSTEHGGITWTRCLGSPDQLLIANAHTWPLPWIAAESVTLDVDSKDGRIDTSGIAPTSQEGAGGDRLSGTGTCTHSAHCISW